MHGNRDRLPRVKRKDADKMPGDSIGIVLNRPDY